MPDTRSHRGAHPEDARDFAQPAERLLRRACEELSYLLTRDYAERAALTLVGDRYQLTVRQRNAVMRAACADPALAQRTERHTNLFATAGQQLAIDGFNVLITIESILSRAPVFEGRDGALRDLASVHGTYRQVQETEQAVELLLTLLEASQLGSVELWLDRPVGNSGRLRQVIESAATRRALPLRVTLSNEVDRSLAALGCCVASSDSWLLDRVPAWLDLPRAVAAKEQLELWLVRMR